MARMLSISPDQDRTDGAASTGQGQVDETDIRITSCAQRAPLDPRFLGGQHKHILYVTSEIDDYVKAGGLGEVSATLPRALRRHCDIRILIPGYPQIMSRHPDMPVVARLPAYAGL